jgi:hypothetical protein
MPPVTSVQSASIQRSRTLWPLALIWIGALALRIAFFTGLALGDDVFYATQSAALTHEGSWPPAPLHWHTRLGIVLPTTLSLEILGLRPLAFVLWPLLASSLAVLVCFRVADDVADRRTAWLAAAFQAAFPLEIIYSTHLFPDVVVALFSVLSIWYWCRALRDDQPRDYLWAGAFFAAAYLCRETVLLEGPIYLALWAWAGRIRRPKLLWVFLIPILVLLLESALYAATAGTALYRWKAVMTQLQDPVTLGMIAASSTGGSFWTDPLFMLLFRQEFGLYHLVALLSLPLVLRNWPNGRMLAVWLCVGYLWLYYGTTSPTSWVTLQRDPRYVASLTVPSVILVARCAWLLVPWLRWCGVALLIISGLFAASLDLGNTILFPHHEFLRSPQARVAVLEPFEYFGARWALGLENPPPFKCAADQGRSSVTSLLDSFEGTEFRTLAETRVFVVSPDRRSDLVARLTGQGWTVTETIPGRVAPGRAFIGRLLSYVPSQQDRAQRILHPRGLVIMTSPADEKKPTMADTDMAQGVPQAVVSNSQPPSASTSPTRATPNVHPRSAPTPNPVRQGRLLRETHMIYQGAFRLTGDAAGQVSATYNYGAHAMAYNAANDSLFIVGHDWQQLIGEVKVPPLKSGVDYDSLNYAAAIQPLANVRVRMPNNTLQGRTVVGGLLVVDGRLIGSDFIYYDADEANMDSHWVVNGTLANGVVSGYHQVGTFGGGVVGGYMGTIPPEWQKRLGGTHLTGLFGVAIISRTSAGPCAFAFDPTQLGVVNPVPVKPLVYYTLQNPLAKEDTQNPLFNTTTFCRGIAFPEDTDSVLFFCRHGTGPWTYNGGPDAPPYVFQVLAYDANEMEQVKNGKKEPWSLRPYDVWQINPGMGNPNAFISNGACWDDVTRRLFWAIPDGGGNGAPVIHVWKIPRR